jgi:hypothetical protein
VLAVKLPSPAYLARNVCGPGAIPFSVTVAAPPAIAADPIGVGPSRNTTVPVGVPAPGGTTATLAVNFTGCRNDAVVGDAASVENVEAGTIVSVPGWNAIA